MLVDLKKKIICTIYQFLQVKNSRCLFLWFAFPVNSHQHFVFWNDTCQMYEPPGCGRTLRAAPLRASDDFSALAQLPRLSLCSTFSLGARCELWSRIQSVSQLQPRFPRATEKTEFVYNYEKHCLGMPTALKQMNVFNSLNMSQLRSMLI